MKRRFSKILGVGLTLALLTSLLLTVAPVSALTQPSVTVDDPEISATNVEYSIIFAITEVLAQDDDIIIDFPEGTDISTVDIGDITIGATSGIGSAAFSTGAASEVGIDGQELTITLATPISGTIAEIGVGATVQVLVDDVDNPDEPGDYTLDVSTMDDLGDEIEAAVTSAPYEIEAPTITQLPGIVTLYNANGILMQQYTGNGAILTAIGDAGADYTVKVGPGTYVLSTGTTLAIPHEGLTLEATGDAEDTILDAEFSGTPAIHIQAADVTIDGFTIDGNPNDAIWIKQGADDVTIENNIFFEGEGSGIVLEGENDGVNVVTGATIADNVFEDCYSAITILAGATDNTISGNTITGSTDSITSITLGGGRSAGLATQGNTITDNTITGNAGSGIWLSDHLGVETGPNWDDNVIEGNTISENEDHGIVIAASATNVTGLQILNNNISDNEKDGIWIEKWNPTNAIKFNNITGNEDYGIDNDSVAVDAALNWWGTDVAADIGDMISDVGASDVTDYEPYLLDTAEAIFYATAVGTGVATLDASTTVGVKVEGAAAADVIAVAMYAANPQEAISDAIAFYDVYVTGGTDPLKIKFYAGDADTALYIWSADTDIWVNLTDDPDAEFGFSAYGGYVYATVEVARLDRTPFALVDAPVADTLNAPDLLSPVSGDEAVSLTPTFSWEAVTDASAYYLQIADNPAFLLPIASLTGDLGRLLSTTYAQVADFGYSDVVYWRVKAVSGTTGGGDLSESIWTEGVFTTMEEPAAEVWMSDDGLTFDTREELEDYLAERAAAEEPADIIIETPDIIVPLPAETPITPGWIYAIIGVGAVLVISLIVLIVRTRRVA